MGCFSGRLMSSASDQKLFCKLCSPFCCSFDEFVEEKVISPPYSSAILTPPYWRVLKQVCAFYVIQAKTKLISLWRRRVYTTLNPCVPTSCQRTHIVIACPWNFLSAQSKEAQLNHNHSKFIHSEVLCSAWKPRAVSLDCFALFSSSPATYLHQLAFWHCIKWSKHRKSIENLTHPKSTINP